MSLPVPLIAQVLRAPDRVRAFSLRDWDRCIAQARAAGLLGRLSYRLDGAEGTIDIPAPVRPHLQSARTAADKHGATMRWEAHCIARALAPLGIPVILLKGAAYLMRGLPVAAGRLFTDVDILVPHARLNDVEAALMLNGWSSTHHDAYDQHYYRAWMHEIPPMIHIQRLNALDVHHTIIPPSSHLHPDPALLIEQAEPLPGHAPLHVLSPTDMVLHSATHLFHEGELHHGLRDVSDLDCLLRDFATQPGFWDALIARAHLLGLGRPLFYALRFTYRFFETPVPAAVLQTCERDGPSWLARNIMDALYDRGLQPFHPSCQGILTPGALSALYLRSHWLRMSLRQLIPHLLHKSLARPKDAPAHT